jgi:crotonobetainyl-CoA:carnitine CoA-transferase CaiB-like acyl-CoA transferase
MEAPETTGAPADGADPLTIDPQAGRSANDAIVSGSTSGYGRPDHRAGWAGDDIDQFTVGGFLAASEPRGDGGPPIPGATAAASRPSGAVA